MGGLAFRELVPHRPPMVLVDSVVEYGPQRITARRTVRQGEPFVDSDGLDDAALLEVIAQTIAAGDALYAKSKKGRVLRGYLTGMTGVAIHSRARIGETIEVSADCLKRMDGMGLFEARAEASGRLLAEGRFKLFVDIAYANSDAPQHG
jgi:predicted hotdog family 3-hydroxylacyl-ACP dehydratase